MNHRPTGTRVPNCAYACYPTEVEIPFRGASTPRGTGLRRLRPLRAAEHTGDTILRRVSP